MLLMIPYNHASGALAFRFSLLDYLNIIQLKILAEIRLATYALGGPDPKTKAKAKTNWWQTVQYLLERGSAEHLNETRYIVCSACMNSTDLIEISRAH